MRISGEMFDSLKPILSKAYDDYKEIRFTYNKKERQGKLTDFGFGPKGPFVTIDVRSTDKKSEYKSFSISGIKDLEVVEKVDAKT